MRIGENGAQQVQNHGAGRLVQEIVDTIRHTLLILDDQLRVVSANRFFYETFNVSAEQTEGRFVYELGDRQWDIPSLRRLLEKIIPTHSCFDDFLVENTFKHLGERVMVLNARQLAMEFGEQDLILLAIEDITESFRIRRRLKDAEERYRRFVEEINSIIIGFDRRGIITFFNHFAEKLFGYRRDEVVGKRPFVGTIVPQVDSRGVDNSHLIEDIFSNPEKHYQIDSEGVCRGGSTIHFSWNIKAQRDSAGVISEILIDGNDITELAQTRTRLEEKSATLDTLLDVIPEGIVITDKHHRVTVVSRYTEKLLGIAADDLMHANEPERLKMLTMYWPGTDRKVRADELPLSKSTVTGKTYEDFQIELRDGSLEKALSVNSAPVLDGQGNIIGAIGWWRDITDRRRHLVEFEQRKRVLDAILDYAPVGIMLVDKDGVITDVSRTQCEYLGLPADRIVGREEQPDEWGILNSSTRNPFHFHCMPLCRAIRNKEVIREEELLLIREGQERVLAVSASPIYDRRREVVGAVTVWRDITKRKQFEEKLRRNQQRLSSMFDVHKAIMLLIDPDTGQIDDANDSAVRFYGFSREVLKSKKIDDLNQLSPALIKQEMQRALHEERDYFVFPHRLSDNRIRWVEVYSSPVPTIG
ncbi:MAG: PAS domain S-box protein, partial [Chitinivibrionales bacterium]